MPCCRRWARTDQPVQRRKSRSGRNPGSTLDGSCRQPAANLFPEDHHEKGQGAVIEDAAATARTWSVDVVSLLKNPGVAGTIVRFRTSSSSEVTSRSLQPTGKLKRPVVMTPGHLTGVMTWRNAAGFNLEYLALPLEGTSFPVRAVRHARGTNSGFHDWLVGLLTAAAVPHATISRCVSR